MYLQGGQPLLQKKRQDRENSIGLPQTLTMKEVSSGTIAFCG